MPLDRNQKLSILQNLDEKTLTKEFVIPLFSEGMGFKNVQYTHGALEFGKDIVYSTEDEFGNRKYTAVQVKSTKITQTNAHQVHFQIDAAFGGPFRDIFENELRYIDRFVLISSKGFTQGAKEALSRALRSSNHIRDVIFIDGNKLVEFLEKYLPNAFWGGKHYLGRLERANYMIRAIESAIEVCRTRNETIEIRMRAAFTSMSNIRHHYKHKDQIADLTPEQVRELDDLLVKERESMIELLDMDCVNLKCVYWPRLKFLTRVESSDKLERAELLRIFLNDSREDKYVSRRQILCDEAGAYGNQLIVGRRIAVVAPPQHGGYTQTFIIDDLQMIDLLIREYDNLFKRILQARGDYGKLGEKDLNIAMLNEGLKMIYAEIEAERTKSEQPQGSMELE